MVLVLGHCLADLTQGLWGVGPWRHLSLFSSFLIFVSSLK